MARFKVLLSDPDPIKIRSRKPDPIDILMDFFLGVGVLIGSESLQSPHRIATNDDATS